MSDDYDLSQIEMSGNSGLDSMLEREAHILSQPTRVKVASLKDLEGFERNSADQLVHISSQDLWALRKGEDGYFVERLFDDQGDPLKG